MNPAGEFVNARISNVESGKTTNVNSQNADVAVGPSTAAKSAKKLPGFGIDTGATPHHDPNDSSLSQSIASNSDLLAQPRFA